MDGIAVIRAVQERFPSIPAMLLTGYAGDDAMLALDISISGTVSLLHKPVRGVEIVGWLGAMLAVTYDEDERHAAVVVPIEAL
jgi:CheY-like chemotaxis protein